MQNSDWNKQGKLISYGAAEKAQLGVFVMFGNTIQV